MGVQSGGSNKLLGNLCLHSSLGFGKIRLFIYSIDVDDGDGTTVVGVELCNCFCEGGVDGFPWELNFGPADEVSGHSWVIDTKAVTNENFDVRVDFSLFIEITGYSSLGFGGVVSTSDPVDFLGFEFKKAER